MTQKSLIRALTNALHSSSRTSGTMPSKPLITYSKELTDFEVTYWPLLDVVSLIDHGQSAPFAHDFNGCPCFPFATVSNHLHVQGWKHILAIIWRHLHIKNTSLEREKRKRGAQSKRPKPKPPCLVWQPTWPSLSNVPGGLQLSLPHIIVLKKMKITIK